MQFKLGEIENLPIADNSVDVVISNCVINLSPDKRKIFSEEGAGFQAVRIIDEPYFPIECISNDPIAKAITENFKIPSEKVKEITDSVVKVSGVKPNKKLNSPLRFGATTLGRRPGV